MQRRELLQQSGISTSTVSESGLLTPSSNTLPGVVQIDISNASYVRSFAGMSPFGTGYATLYNGTVSPSSGYAGNFGKSAVQLAFMPGPAGRRFLFDCETDASFVQVKDGSQVIHTFNQGDPLFVVETTGGWSTLEITGSPGPNVTGTWDFYGCVVSALQ